MYRYIYFFDNTWTRRCSSFFRDQVIVIVIVTLTVIVIVIVT